MRPLPDVTPPNNVKTESQRMSYHLRKAHTCGHKKLHDKYEALYDAHDVAFSKAETDAKNGNYGGNTPPWAASSNFYQNGILSFPPGLNQANEGAVLSFVCRMFGLLGLSVIELSEDFRTKMEVARTNCREGTWWD